MVRSYAIWVQGRCSESWQYCITVPGQHQLGVSGDIEDNSMSSETWEIYLNIPPSGKA